MIVYRPYRNNDPPVLMEVWNEAATGRGAYPIRTPAPLERWIFSKPYFDPNAMIIAEEVVEGTTKRIVGFSLSGFGPNDEHTGPSQDRGFVCCVLVRPSHRHLGIGGELVRRGEQYLIERGAKTLVFGSQWPTNPHLFGFGVIVAAVGGRNPMNLGPATAIEFIDEQSGATLWTAAGDPAVAIGDEVAYVLNAGSLEAHDIRTGTSRWRQETDAAQVSANDHVVVVSGATGTVAYDTSGNQLWEVPFGVDRDPLFHGGLLVGRDSVFVVTSPGLYSTQCPGG